MAEINKGRRPMPGDAVRYTGEFVRRVLLCGKESESYYLPLDSRGRLGIIGGVLGEPFEKGLVTFNPYRGRGFRGGNRGVKDEGVVSVSGGPSYYISASELEHDIGDHVTMHFWCWKSLPCANGGENYSQKVPVWNWDPDKEGVDE